MHFTLDGLTLPSLNEYTAKCRGNAFGANAMKKRCEKAITALLPADRPAFDYPVHIAIEWVEPSNRRDVDNVMFSAKFILDAMVKAGLLESDSRRFVSGITHTVSTDKTSPRIEVTVREERS